MRRPACPAPTRRTHRPLPLAPLGYGIQTAIAYYDQALGHDPGFGRAHSARARALLSLSECTRRAARRRPARGPRRGRTGPGDRPRRPRRVGGDRRGSPRARPRSRRRPRRLRERCCRGTPATSAPTATTPGSSAPRSPGAEAIAVADRAFSLDPLCIVMQTCAWTSTICPATTRARCRAAGTRSKWSPSRAGAPLAASLALVQLRTWRRRGRDLRCRP